MSAFYSQIFSQTPLAAVATILQPLKMVQSQNPKCHIRKKLQVVVEEIRLCV